MHVDTCLFALVKPHSCYIKSSTNKRDKIDKRKNEIDKSKVNEPIKEVIWNQEKGVNSNLQEGCKPTKQVYIEIAKRGGKRKWEKPREVRQIKGR